MNDPRELHESELIEQAALIDLHDAAGPALRDSLALHREYRDGAVVSLAGALPASAIVINRALGLGVSEPASREGIRSIVSMYRDAGVGRYFIQRHPDARPGEIAHWLQEAGLEKARGWQKFERGPESAPVLESDLSVREIGPEQGTLFSRIVCDAFDLGEEAVPWLAALAGRERWYLFMSFAGDEPAGAGALFVNEGCAWTDFGATSP